MIISYKYKFLFIGLPFSASSAITKELHKEYEGKPYLRKHSLYHEFERVATTKDTRFTLRRASQRIQQASVF